VSDDVYRPSGRVAWLRLILATIVALPVVLLLSDLAFRLDRARYFPPLLGPVLVGSLAGVLAVAVVEWGKCRDVVFGRTIGVLFTLIFFLGFFQRSLIDARTRGSPEGIRGVPIAELVGGLPNYIALRMRNFELAPDAAQPNETHRMLTTLRWTVFVMELAALAGIGWWFGGAAARRPFAEHRGVWMTAKRFALPGGMAATLHEWLEGRSPLPQQASQGELVDLALLEHDPPGAEDDGFLTLFEGTGGARRPLTRRRRVSFDRLAALRDFLRGDRRA
jgi:hypothetical protein